MDSVEIMIINIGNLSNTKYKDNFLYYKYLSNKTNFKQHEATAVWLNNNNNNKNRNAQYIMIFNYFDHKYCGGVFFMEINYPSLFS